MPPGEGATIRATVSHTDGTQRTCLLDLVRGQSGRPFLVCPYCDARRAHLYAFLRRMERRGWVPAVPPRAFACRTCHRIRYASQYDNRPRDLARGAARFGMFIAARTIRRGETEERRAAVAAERANLRYRRACDRERVRLARAERERRARRRAEARATGAPPGAA